MKPITHLSAVLLLSFVIAGCKDQNIDTDTKNNSSTLKEINEVRKVSKDEASVPFKPIGLYDESLHQEPDTSSWKVEEFNQLVGKQFKKLEKVIQNPKEIINESYDYLLSNNFNPNSLTPEKKHQKWVIFGNPGTLQIELPLQREHRSCIFTNSPKRTQN